jgi:hypothetical protein
MRPSPRRTTVEGDDGEVGGDEFPQVAAEVRQRQQCQQVGRSAPRGAGARVRRAPPLAQARARAPGVRRDPEPELKPPNLLGAAGEGCVARALALGSLHTD